MTYSVVWETEELYVERWNNVETWNSVEETYYLIYPATTTEGEMGIKVSNDEMIAFAKRMLELESEE